MKWVLLFAALGYVALVLLMYLAQRSLLYFPDPARRSPASVGLPQAEEVALTTADSEHLVAWHVPPRDGKPVVLYFQGNGGGLDLRVERFRQLTGDGVGLVALNYRGYGGSTGSPSETGLIADALAAYDFAAERYPAARIMLWGESLGTAVAVALGAQRPVARILLESAFTSIADVAAAHYWYVPVRLLIKDAFRSDRRIGRVSAPILVLHGADDPVVPARFAERLYALIVAPKRFVRLPGAGHNDHDQYGAAQIARQFFSGGMID
jgi:hypothetical protein